MTSQLIPLDMNYVRSQFPALDGDWVFFDNAGGSQILKPAVERITEFLYKRNVQIGGSYAISQAAAEGLMKGRLAAQDLVNAARPEEIVFGPTTSALMQTLANSIRNLFKPGDEIIVSMADHESNIGPWQRLSEYGVIVKTWPVNHDTYQLSLDDLGALMSERTKLVCVTHCSNILGRVNPIADYARFAHEHGAQICVDAVAYAPHRHIDVQAWDVDYYVFSLYKCYGPHTAVMYGKYNLLAELDSQYHYFYGKDKVPGKLEPGNPNYELAYSTEGIVEYLASLGEKQGEDGSRREKLIAGYHAIARQEEQLTKHLICWLVKRNDCRIIGSADTSDNARVPTVAFKFDHLDSGAIAAAMDAYGVAIRFGDFHSRRLIEDLGEDKKGGVVRVSMVHYNTLDEVDRLTDALSEIVEKLRG